MHMNRQIIQQNRILVAFNSWHANRKHKNLTLSSTSTLVDLTCRSWRRRRKKNIISVQVCRFGGRPVDSCICDRSTHVERGRGTKEARPSRIKGDAGLTTLSRSSSETKQRIPLLLHLLDRPKQARDHGRRARHARRAQRLREGLRVQPRRRRQRPRAARVRRPGARLRPGLRRPRVRRRPCAAARVRWPWAAARVRRPRAARVPSTRRRGLPPRTAATRGKATRRRLTPRSRHRTTVATWDRTTPGTAAGTATPVGSTWAAASTAAGSGSEVADSRLRSVAACSRTHLLLRAFWLSDHAPYTYAYVNKGLRTVRAARACVR